jgi:hypothetical protein
MANPFLSIVVEAAAKRWCVTPYCTTCGAHEYRAALRQLAGPLGGPLCDALSAVSPAELTCVPHWEEALEVAIRDLPIGSQVEAVLGAWLPHVGLTPRFDDVVLYRIVRSLGQSSSIRESWIRAAIPCATRTRDHSLVETLLLVLGPSVSRFPELVVVASELATDSKQMHRVLKNVCGTDPA